jgi:hypothetical protein
VSTKPGQLQARSTRDLLNTLAAITAKGDHRQESRFQIPWRHMGRHHDIARPLEGRLCVSHREPRADRQAAR